MRKSDKKNREAERTGTFGLPQGVGGEGVCLLPEKNCTMTE